MWSAWKAMGWHRIWFVPLYLLVLLVFVLPAIITGFRNGSIILHHFNWRLLFSISLDIWLAVVPVSIILPAWVAGMGISQWGPGRNRALGRVATSLIAMFSACCVEVITQFVLWGAMPLDNGPDGIIVRFIPFVPWPSTPFLP
jgi:hypothetical protein